MIRRFLIALFLLFPLTVSFSIYRIFDVNAILANSLITETVQIDSSRWLQKESMLAVRRPSTVNMQDETLTVEGAGFDTRETMLIETYPSEVLPAPEPSVEPEIAPVSVFVESISEPTSEPVLEQNTEPTPETTPPPSPTNPVSEPICISTEEEIRNLTNLAREKAGLPVLTGSGPLDQAAMQRAKELILAISHQRPDGRDFYSVLGEFGLAAQACAENIACGTAGAYSPEAIVNLWLSSAGHKTNLLGSQYTQSGIGYVVSGDTAYYVQLFVG